MPRTITHVDMNAAHGRFPAPGSLLIGLVLAALTILLFVSYHQLTQQNEVLRQQWLSRQARQQPVSTTSVTVHPAMLAELAQAQTQIQIPWMSLLEDLERTQHSGLYWMQLAPDAKRKQIRMTLLAQQRQQGWVLVGRLKQQASLAAVTLNASEATEVSGLAMTTLHLEAQWKF